MTPEQFKRAEQLYFEARELPPEERAAFLEKQCADDADVRERVRRLLWQGEETQELGEVRDKVAAVASQTATQDVEPQPGDMIGRYRLVREIGAGGMGVVYEAEQVEPVTRRVALKLIKAGMDTRDVVARFESERQALALMDHPNVAAVLDGGSTAQGRPYFVMEFVPGEPITEYCDKQRLSLAERLDLFTQVCHAIQHAHQKGVIHRDIKPSNVLVRLQDDKPTPVVIDFGVAKATSRELTQQTFFTQHGAVVGTPEYMSPEQADGSTLDIDTRTDVYSLGVLLYELLTGTLPFDPMSLRIAGLGEILRIIREVEPPRPSTRLSGLRSAVQDDTGTLAARHRRLDPRSLTRRLRGDLDWIVMKALEKDRTRRYGSASDLAADIQRHMEQQPVVAGPPSAAYRFRKFVRRNRGKVLAASLVTCVLVLGVVGTTWGMVWALSERERAEDALSDAVAAWEQTDAERARAVDAERQATTNLTRARQAEQEAQRQLAEVHAYAARLCVQRGDWQGALENYDRALQAGHPDEVALLLGKLEVAILVDVKTARHELELLKQRGDLGKHAGRAMLAEAELMQGTSFDAQDALPLIEKALELGLPPASAAYARARLAETIPEAINHLEETLRLEPFHQRAHDLLVQVLFVMGRFDEVRQRLAVTRLMHPESPEPDIGEVVMCAFEGDRTGAYAALERARVRLPAELIEGMEASVPVILWSTGIFDGSVTVQTGARTPEDVAREIGNTADAPPSDLSLDAEPEIGDVDLATLINHTRTMADSSLVDVEFDDLWAQTWTGGSVGGFMSAPCVANSLGRLFRVVPLVVLGQYEPALDEAENVVEACPTGFAQLVRAHLLGILGRYEELAAVCHDILEMPSIVDVRLVALSYAFDAEHILARRSTGQRRREFEQRALGTLRQMLDLELISEDKYYRLIDFAIQMDEFDLARALIRSYASHGGDSRRLALERVRTEFFAGNYGSVVLMADAALVGDPDWGAVAPYRQRALGLLGEIGRPGTTVSVERYLETAPRGDDENSEYRLSHAKSLIELARTLENRGDPLQSEAAYRESLVMLRELLPADAHEIILALRELGALLLKRGAYEEAEPLLREYLDIQRETRPDNDLAVAHAMSALGEALAGQGAYEEAETLLLHSHDVMANTRLLPYGHKIATVRRIISLYEQQGLTEKAAEWRAKLKDQAMKPVDSAHGEQEGNEATE